MIYTLYMDDQEENFVGTLPAKAICQTDNPKLVTGIDIGNIFTLAKLMEGDAIRERAPYTGETRSLHGDFILPTRENGISCG